MNVDDKTGQALKEAYNKTNGALSTLAHALEQPLEERNDYILKWSESVLHDLHAACRAVVTMRNSLGVQE